LADHGIRDYGRIKEIVSFQIPQSAFFFAVRFGRRTLEEVLNQIERWKKFLETDFLLLDNHRAEVEKWIVQTEVLVCNALVQANLPGVGDWELRYNWIPTGTDEAGTPVFIGPGLAITARHRRTGEVRKALIPSQALYASNLGANPFQKAFEELGLWEILKKGFAASPTDFCSKGPGLADVHSIYHSAALRIPGTTLFATRELFGEEEHAEG
jgi:hypothetical protein